MRQATRTCSVLAVAAALAAVSCQGRQRANYTVQPNPNGTQQPTDGSGQAVDPITGEPVDLPSGVADPNDPNVPQSEDPADIAAATGLTTVQIDRGRVYVNGWTGDQDEISGKWKVKNVADAGAGAGPTSTITPPTGGSGGAVVPNTSTTPPATTPPAANPDVVEFRIKAGTGNGAWNTKETEVVAKVGKRFVIYNDDTVTHQWHTNGTPCPHGNPIAPGRSAECVPSAAYSGGPLYDHITNGQFFIRAE